jgi:hypothetical protein
MRASRRASESPNTYPQSSPRPRRSRGWSAARAVSCAVALLLCGCGKSSETAPVAAGGRDRVRVPGISFTVPTEWMSESPETPMRLAQYRVAGSGGAAALIVYRFAGGGSAQANVERWVSQFHAADGSSARDRAVVTREQRTPLTLTSLDVSGSYSGQQMPGAPAQPAIADARLLALVVEGSDDPYFFKLLGPASTVSQWADAWRELAASVAPE